MKFLKCVTLLIVIFATIGAKGQLNFESPSLKKYEIALLDILSKDSIHPLNIQLDGDVFRFGVPTMNNSNIALIKNKKEIFVQILGSGRLYQVKKDPKFQYQLLRLDSTFFNGANFNALTFFLNDTLFQYGGNGHWNLRGFITYFSPKTHEWELYTSNRTIAAYLGLNHNLILNVDHDNNQLYLSNALEQYHFPQSLSVKSIDSTYRFDNKTHQWHTLGSTNPNLMSMINIVNFQYYEMGDFVILQKDLDFHWLHFSKNQYGPLNEKRNNEIKEIWLSLYSNNSKYNSIQFCLGNTIYFIKIGATNELTYKQFDLTSKDFNYNKISPIYFIVNPYLDAVIKNMTEIVYFGIGLLLLFILNYIIRKRKKKKEISTEVAQILNLHFFQTLSNIEKELLDVLYEKNLKGELMTTQMINKIIGVQQKDIMTQNKNRSDHFLKINQKFKFATQKELPLIIKTRDSIDKRQYNYGLQEEYITELRDIMKH